MEIIIFDLPSLISLSCLTLRSKSYISLSLITFSLLCPTTLLTSEGLTVTSTSLTFTFNFLISSTIESYQISDSTNCLKAGWYGPATTSLSSLFGSVIVSVFCNPTLITSIFLEVNILTKSLVISTACTIDNGVYVPSLYSFSNLVFLITKTG
ncbi:hypothetical protein D3C72_1343430 [compost metagenome]